MAKLFRALPHDDMSRAHQPVQMGVGTHNQCPLYDGLNSAALLAHIEVVQHALGILAALLGVNVWFQSWVRRIIGLDLSMDCILLETMLYPLSNEVTVVAAAGTMLKKPQKLPKLATLFIYVLWLQVCARVFFLWIYVYLLLQASDSERILSLSPCVEGVSDSGTWVLDNLPRVASPKREQKRCGTRLWGSDCASSPSKTSVR